MFHTASIRTKARTSALAETYVSQRFGLKKLEISMEYCRPKLSSTSGSPMRTSTPLPLRRSKWTSFAQHEFFRFWHLADVATAFGDVRFRGCSYMAGRTVQEAQYLRAFLASHASPSGGREAVGKQ
jgi:hypothetical protein